MATKFQSASGLKQVRGLGSAKSGVHHWWLQRVTAVGTFALAVWFIVSLILLPNPNASRDDYIDGLKLTQAEYEVVVSLDERSRCFLVKQGHASSVCQLNLRGMDDALSVISASTDNIEIMHEVLRARAEDRGVTIDQLRPEDWLDQFYANRKGSGRAKLATSKPATARIA